MAALPGAPALPLPARAAALFATLFADANRDPTGGDWGPTMVVFAIDNHNAAANIPINELRQMTTSSITTSDNPAGYVIASGGVG